VTRLAVYVVTDRIVSQLRLQCCRMGLTIYQRVMTLLPPTWQHHRLMIAFTIAPIIKWEMTGVVRYGTANLKLDVSLLQ
jgi:hypothetical protein